MIQNYDDINILANDLIQYQGSEQNRRPQAHYASFAGPQVHSGRRTQGHQNRRPDNHEMARAFQALQRNSNPVNISQQEEQQILNETQNQQNCQNVHLHDRRLQHQPQSNNQDRQVNSPLDLKRIDSRLSRQMTCLAQEGSESPCYSYDQSPLITSFDTDMNDNQKQTRMSITSMNSGKSSANMGQMKALQETSSLSEHSEIIAQSQILSNQLMSSSQKSGSQITNQFQQIHEDQEYSQIIHVNEYSHNSQSISKGSGRQSINSINDQKNEIEVQDQSMTESLPQYIYETTQEIGDGMHANIYLAQKSVIIQNEIVDKQIIAVKVFKPYTDQNSKLSAGEEYRVGQLLKGHQNIIKISSFEQQKPISINGKIETRDYLTLDFCENRDLFTFMEAYGKRQIESGSKKAQGQGLLVRDQRLLVSIFKQLIEGISGMHNQAGFAHMDIKLENILVADDGSLKFCDFGFATPLGSYIDKKMGTPVYMAPEIHQAADMPCKAYPSDIFSLGVLFFMLAFGAPPFHTAEITDCYFSYIVLKPGNTDFFKYHPHTRQLFRDKKIPQSFMNLLMQMLMAEPGQRVQDVTQILENDFIQSQEEGIQLNELMIDAVRNLTYESNQIKED